MNRVPEIGASRQTSTFSSRRESRADKWVSSAKVKNVWLSVRRVEMQGDQVQAEQILGAKECLESCSARDCSFGHFYERLEPCRFSSSVPTAAV